MPINENLPKIIHKSHNLRECHRRQHEYDCLEAFLSVKLMPGSYMTWEQLKQYIPSFVDATWGIHDDFTDEEREDIVCRMFKGEHLPGAMESFKFTFLVKGMTYIGVSHFLRHREITASAKCGGDRNLSDETIMVPEAIMNSPELFNRYIKTCEEQFEIYCDLVESGKVSTMDARYVLPQSMEQDYFFTMDWKTLVKVVGQRQDRGVQPAIDNLVAYGIIEEILKVYPKLKDLHIFNVDAPNKFYIANARKERSTNLYLPEPQDDVFEYRLDDFVYPCHREDLNGTNPQEEKSWFQIRLEKIRNLLK